VQIVALLPKLGHRLPFWTQMHAVTSRQGAGRQGDK
jgi:hypothetical protein